MKCLTIFIISLFVLFSIIECSKTENNSMSDVSNMKIGKDKTKSNKVKKYKTITTCKNECRKKNTFIPILPKPLKRMNLSAGDLTVCQSGKNLGLLDMGTTCPSTYSQCSKMVVREPYIPVRSKITKVKAANGLLKASRKSAIKRKPRKRWSLKGRYEKFHPKKELPSAEKDRRRKNKQDKMKIKNLKKWAQNIINNRIHTNSITKKSLTKSSKRVVNDILQGKVGSLRRSLGVKRTKEITNNNQRIQNVEPEHAKYCVQAIEMNLSYCCMFTMRSLAQKLANDQPARPRFNREVRKGWLAHMRDGERKATLKIKEVTKTLREMNKLRNILKKKQKENKAAKAKGKNENSKNSKNTKKTKAKAKGKAK